MDKIREKINVYLINSVLKIFGGSPRRYWVFVIGFLFLALFGIFALDALVFWRMNSSAFRKIYVLPEGRIETIDQKILIETVEMLKARETAFSEILSAPPLKDPSR